MNITYRLCLAATIISVDPHAVASDHAAAPANYTSSQLVTDLRGTPRTPKADQTPFVLYKQRHAEGYLAGVMDATEGNVWCRPAKIKPGELQERVWTTLEANSPKSSRSAGKDIVQTLRSLFPCPQRAP